MKQVDFYGDQYALTMKCIRDRIVAEDGGAMHDQLSELYHTLGSYYGYEDRQ